MGSNYFHALAPPEADEVLFFVGKNKPVVLLRPVLKLNCCLMHNEARSRRCGRHVFTQCHSHTNTNTWSQTGSEGTERLVREFKQHFCFNLIGRRLATIHTLGKCHTFTLKKKKELRLIQVLFTDCSTSVNITYGK